jgi:hypothetical protein
VKRQRVQGVILAPVASRIVEAEVPAVFELPGVGRFPAYLTGLRSEPGEITYRFRGAPERAVKTISAALVRRVTFASDRVAFLSALEPAKVEEVPLLGTQAPFPWKRDLAAGGGPLALAGKVYRKGLGVHSRSLLEYDIGGAYRSFAAMIGLDDAAGPRGAVVFRVLGDGKEIYRKEKARGEAPERVLLPLNGVQRLRLEVDFGADGVDFCDHADWADARITR